MTSKINFYSPLEDFHRARLQASILTILSGLNGKKDGLISFDEIRKAFGSTESSARILKDIPIDAIKGSVNRYTDFTRIILPKQTIDAQSWARGRVTDTTLIGFPPIDVYQIGGIFFVLDGNHRVAIARHQGNSHIQAYVKEVNTQIHLPENFQPDNLIIKNEYFNFLESTNFDRIFPHTKLLISSPGKFPIIHQQIKAIHFALELKKNTSVPFNEAVIYWHNEIYWPIIETIKELELIQEFPSRSEADLYLWIMKYQAKLIEEYGWDISSATTSKKLYTQFWKRITRIKNKAKKLYHHWLYGPPVGIWRNDRILTQQERLFSDILIVLNGSPNDQNAIDLSINIAEIEGAKLFGLYISEPNNSKNDYKISRYQKDFIKQCVDSNVKGELAIIFVNNPVNQILRRAALTSLVVFPLSTRRKQKINLSKLIQKCPTPIIAVNEDVRIPLKKSLLSFNESSKSKEALLLGAYISKFWESSLVVLSSSTSDNKTEKSFFDAFEYLEKYNIKADFIKSVGPPGIATTTFAIKNQCDIIIIGGYSSSTIKKKLSGSIVDEVLFKSKKPVLICK